MKKLAQKNTEKRDSVAKCSKCIFSFLFVTALLLAGCGGGGGGDGALNQPPVAIAGCATTPQEQLLIGKLVATDVDNTPDQLIFSLVNDGSKGTVTINPVTGEYEYTPLTSGPRGLDTFTFKVEDVSGGTSTATETVIVHQKVMLLGDSITRGFLPTEPDPKLWGGYRKPLYASLSGFGFVFDFVGSDALTGSDPTLLPFDSDNEGHGGLTANELAFGDGAFVGIRNALVQTPADVVLIHAGTNQPSTASDVQSILDEIDQWESGAGGNPVTVILARIIDDNIAGTNVTAFNNNVAAMVNDRITNFANPAYPDDVILVDQQSALTYPNDYSDNLHPNSTGYNIMAGVWLPQLASLLETCP